MQLEKKDKFKVNHIISNSFFLIIIHQKEIETPSIIHKKYYEVWESKNMVFFKGKIMIGSDCKAPFGTFLIINIPSIIYEVFVAPPLAKIGDKWSSFIIVLVILILTNIFFWWTLLKDPGIIPRKALIHENDKEKSRIPNKNIPKRSHFETTINTHFLRVKYCQTCHIYRPPRASHCHICDNCVERFDHHCPWLGICIGKRNYRLFYSFVFWATVLDLYILASSIAHMVIQGSQYEGFDDFLKDYPVSMIIGGISFLFMFFVFGLCSFHTYLLIRNQTTYENIKKTWIRISGNPFEKKKIFKNLWKMLTFPIRKSFIELRKIVVINLTPAENATHEERSKTRSDDNLTVRGNIPFNNTNYNGMMTKIPDQKKNETSTINKLEMNHFQSYENNKTEHNVNLPHNPNERILDQLDIMPLDLTNKTPIAAAIINEKKISANTANIVIKKPIIKHDIQQQHQKKIIDDKDGYLTKGAFYQPKIFDNIKTDHVFRNQNNSDKQDGVLIGHKLRKNFSIMNNSDQLDHNPNEYQSNNKVIKFPSELIENSKPMTMIQKKNTFGNYEPINRDNMLKNQRQQTSSLFKSYQNVKTNFIDDFLDQTDDIPQEALSYNSKLYADSKFHFKTFGTKKINEELANNHDDIINNPKNMNSRMFFSMHNSNYK